LWRRSHEGPKVWIYVAGKSVGHPDHLFQVFADQAAVDDDSIGDYL
jgi:hypothetical protein